MYKGLRAGISGVALLASAWSTASFAQTGSVKGSADEASPDSEIVVTATRQTEVLSKVPISVAAYNQQMLDNKGVRRIEDLARITPGLNISRKESEGGSGLQISIRGIASDIGQSTTGIYIDDTPIQTRASGSEITNPFPQLFDLERVEVLRGPQGTLFGAGAQGGAVRFITPKPSLTKYTGYSRAELATTEHGGRSYEGGSALGGPIIEDRLGFRVSGVYRRDGGWVDRVDYQTGALLQKDANSSTSYALRGALLWTPVDDLEIGLSVFHQRQRSQGTPTMWESISDLDKHVFKNGRRLAQPGRDTFTIPSLDINYDFGGVTLTSTTSGLRRRNGVVVDYSTYFGSLLLGSPTAYAPGEYSKAEISDSLKGFNQEIRLQSSNDSPLTWTCRRPTPMRNIRRTWSTCLFRPAIQASLCHLIPIQMHPNGRAQHILT